MQFFAAGSKFHVLVKWSNFKALAPCGDHGRRNAEVTTNPPADRVCPNCKKLLEDKCAGCGTSLDKNLGGVISVSRHERRPFCKTCYVHARQAEQEYHDEEIMKAYG